ncbi:MAG TPA: ATP-binding protein [Candidatus Limnocylindria bacterium]|nr:ATP-binding protein [Candidatus Limnocylindria bacterium]
MKTILVLANHPELADAIRSALDPERYRVVHRLNSDDAEPLLNHALVHVCIMESDIVETLGMWLFEKIRRRLPNAPIIVYAGEGAWALEEEAYLAGVQHVLHKPVRGRLLETVLEQSGPAQRLAAVGRATAPAKANQSVSSRPANENALRVLQSWRDFASLLPNALSTEALLKQFLLQLREITGVNRAAIFLRPPIMAPGHGQSSGGGRSLRSACAIGLSTGILDSLELSLEAGIGGHVFHHGRILWRDSHEAHGDSEIEREFSLLGAQVVVPILDQQALVGVAAFDSRITGEPLSKEELEIIFHVLEEVGLGIRNIWFHDQLVANQQMLTDILRQFNNGCVVVGRDLNVLHCNETARRFLLGSRREADLQFSDLPVVLGSKLYQVLKSGAALAPFRFQPADSSKAVYQISMVPLQSRPAALPDSALMVLEDRTQTEQLHTLELETGNLRLIKSMADRLAHEIGNALVPVSTHQQLLGDQYLDPDFRDSLNVALSEGVKRISRLVNQMRFLSRDTLVTEESFPLGPVVEEAFREAQTHQPVKSAFLKYEGGDQPSIVSGDRAALKHAFLEVFVNALQANPQDARVAVRLKADQSVSGKSKRWAQIEVQDNGAGFTPEALSKVPSPFFTTRTVGLGLGLTVTRKIIETHHGTLEIVKSPSTEHGVVRILLPQSAH